MNRSDSATLFLLGHNAHTYSTRKKKTAVEKAVAKKKANENANKKVQLRPFDILVKSIIETEKEHDKTGAERYAAWQADCEVRKNAHRKIKPFKPLPNPVHVSRTVLERDALRMQCLLCRVDTVDQAIQTKTKVTKRLLEVGNSVVYYACSVFSEEEKVLLTDNGICKLDEDDNNSVISNVLLDVLTNMNLCNIIVFVYLSMLNGNIEHIITKRGPIELKKLSSQRSKSLIKAYMTAQKYIKEETNRIKEKKEREIRKEEEELARRRATFLKIPSKKEMYKDISKSDLSYDKETTDPLDLYPPFFAVPGWKPIGASIKAEEIKIVEESNIPPKQTPWSSMAKLSLLEKKTGHKTPLLHAQEKLIVELLRDEANSLPLHDIPEHLKERAELELLDIKESNYSDKLYIELFLIDKETDKKLRKIERQTWGYGIQLSWQILENKKKSYAKCVEELSNNRLFPVQIDYMISHLSEMPLISDIKEQYAESFKKRSYYLLRKINPDLLVQVLQLEKPHFLTQLVFTAIGHICKWNCSSWKLTVECCYEIINETERNDELCEFSMYLYYLNLFSIMSEQYNQVHKILSESALSFENMRPVSETCYYLLRWLKFLAHSLFSFQQLRTALSTYKPYFKAIAMQNTEIEAKSDEFFNQLAAIGTTIEVG